MLISPGKLGTGCSSAWAQGGIAAALGADDSSDLHVADTIKAGDGLCQPHIVNQTVADAVSVIESLIAYGVDFDRDTSSVLLLGLEAAHSRRRIVHAQGANTGAAIMAAMVKAVRAAPSIEIVEGATVAAIHAPDGAVQGIVLQCRGDITLIPANGVVLATGGAGALWYDTTNPLGSWGSGLALAARAGAMLGDLEFMQFHPTAIAIGRDPMPLASEALRGEGCTLIDETGARFVDELQRRDIVARAIAAHGDSGHQVFLDARQALGAAFAKRFPAIDAICKNADIDPATMPIPVRPAAHYHMGGVVTNENGRTSIEGLWACGEVACTGLHGANRLASNSLLEAAVFGARVAADIAGCALQSEATHKSVPRNNLADTGDVGGLREAMSQYLGVLRDQNGLTRFVRQFYPLIATSDRAAIALMIALAALRRRESRGAHARRDYSQTAQTGMRMTMTLPQALQEAEMIIAARSQPLAIGA